MPAVPHVPTDPNAYKMYWKDIVVPDYNDVFDFVLDPGSFTAF